LVAGRRTGRGRDNKRIAPTSGAELPKEEYLISGVVFSYPNEDAWPSLEGYGLDAVPVRRRLHWIIPSLIYAGCMVSFPVIFAGAMLLQRYSFFRSVLAIVVAAVAIIVFDWINAALGADLGLPASMLSRSAFGAVASRFLISFLLLFMCLGWYSIQIEITSHLTLLAFGVNSIVGTNQTLYFLTTAILGLIFALPAVIGTRLFPWINYIAIPVILLTGLGGVVLTVLKFGGLASTFNILLSMPDSGSSLALGVTSLIGVASAQFLMLADYSRYARRLWPDTFLIPLVGILPAGIFLFLIGIFLSLNGGGWEVTQTLVLNLNFPIWVVAFLIFAQGSTVLVGAYSAGLALANVFNITKAHSRSWVTVLAVFIGIGIAMFDPLSQLEAFLFIIALACPVVGIILAIDHFLLRNRNWQHREGVNWIAVLATLGGCLLGALLPFGYPTFLGIFSAALLYYAGMWLQSQFGNSIFVPEQWRPETPKRKERPPFLYLGYLGMGIAALVPIWAPTPWSEIAVIFGCLITGLGFFLQVWRERRLAIENE